MKHKSALPLRAAIITCVGFGLLYGQQKPQTPSPDKQKIQVLNDALKNGLLTQDEYNAKLKAIQSSGAPARASVSTSPASRGMKTVEVLDPLFKQRAYSLTIPADWRFEGTILRGENGAAQLVYRTSSPDGLTGAQSLPEYAWQWSNDPAYLRFLQQSHTPAVPPMSAGDFVKKAVLPEARPNAQVEAIEPVPGLSDKLADQDRQINQQLAAMAQRPGTSSTVHSDAARVRIQYNFNGHAEEEWIGVLINSQEFPGIGPSTPGFSISHATVWASRAPRGQLESTVSVFKQIGASLKPDPAWQQQQIAMLAQRLKMQTAQVTKMAQDSTAQMLSQNAAWRASQQAKFQASMNSAKALSDAGHAGAVGFSQHMGDHQTMLDPSTGRTGEVSNQFTRSWANQDGQVIQGNSPTFDPNAQLRGNWTQLQPIKPTQ